MKGAFSKEWLEGAWFGLTPSHGYDRRTHPRPKIEGVVLMSLSLPSGEASMSSGRAFLYVYRVPTEAMTESDHKAVVELMTGPMRRWLEAKMTRSETQIFGADSLLVELRDGRLLLHETTFR